MSCSNKQIQLIINLINILIKFLVQFFIIVHQIIVFYNIIDVIQFSSSIINQQHPKFIIFLIHLIYVFQLLLIFQLLIQLHFSLLPSWLPFYFSQLIQLLLLLFTILLLIKLHVIFFQFQDQKDLLELLYLLMGLVSYWLSIQHIIIDLY